MTKPIEHSPVPAPDAALSRRHARVALACTVFVGAMVGAAFASVPLYDLFCRATGFGGTPQVASVAPDRALARHMTVRFDANVAPGLDWDFKPNLRAVDVVVGEPKLVTFTVVNTSNKDLWGSATYNVSPEQTGAYFSKLQCFCFDRQQVKAGETISMPVVFFVDPSIADERDLDNVNTITLSYTFFAAKPPKPVVQAAAGGPKS